MGHPTPQPDPEPVLRAVRGPLLASHAAELARFDRDHFLRTERNAALRRDVAARHAAELDTVAAAVRTALEHGTATDVTARAYGDHLPGPWQDTTFVAKDAVVAGVPVALRHESAACGACRRTSTVLSIARAEVTGDVAAAMRSALHTQLMVRGAHAAMAQQLLAVSDTALECLVRHGALFGVPRQPTAA